MDDKKAQVYIKIDGYRQLKEVIGQTRAKLQQARALLDKLGEINGQEDAALKTWSRDLDEMENKVSDVDKALFEPEV